MSLEGLKNYLINEKRQQEVIIYVPKHLMPKATCSECDNFLGGGDFELCCSNPPKARTNWFGFLCYEDTPACENYIERKKKE